MFKPNSARMERPFITSPSYERAISAQSWGGLAVIFLGALVFICGACVTGESCAMDGRMVKAFLFFGVFGSLFALGWITERKPVAGEDESDLSARDLQLVIQYIKACNAEEVAKRFVETRCSGKLSYRNVGRLLTEIEMAALADARKSIGCSVPDGPR